MFGTLFFKDYFSAEGTATVDSVPADTEETLEISSGKAALLSAGASDESKLTRWETNDSTTVTVDSGGRIDALKTGTANITAYFSDGHKAVYHVTVTKPGAEEKPDLFSTAITANADVAAKNLKSKSKQLPYYIYVNRKQNCVTVYTYDQNGDYTVPVRAMVCSCGKKNSTIPGTYYIYYHTEWHPLVNNVFAKYTSAFSDDFLFHSVPYTDLASDTLKVDEFNKLGTDASLGCVRMSVGDCKWLYDNCAADTPIKIYDDNASPGPLGKPDSIKITDKTCGWDPTDNDPKNPYNKKFPEITGAKDCTVKVGSSYTMASGVTAKDTCSNDITDKIEILGNVNTERAGVYRVTYTVTDLLHRSASKEITVTVEE